MTFEKGQQAWNKNKGWLSNKDILNYIKFLFENNISNKRCNYLLYQKFGIKTNISNLWAKIYNQEERKKHKSILCKISQAGENNSFFGKHHTEATRRKIKEKETGKKLIEETKEKIKKVRLNKTYEEIYGEKAREIKEKISLSKSGENNPNFGKHFSKERIIKISVGNKENLENINKLKERMKGNQLRKGREPWNINKTFEELYGEEKAKAMKEKISLSLSGEKNPNWNNGSSFEPYGLEFNKQFKYLIRLRDNFCCLNCGIPEQEYIKLFHKKLHIHHIDHNKKNTCFKNCCALCTKCNTLANKKRHEWKEYYQKKLAKLYGYKY